MTIDLSQLINKRFDCLVVKKSYRDEKGRIKCICQCKCGNEKEVFYVNLLSGRTKSCGHLEEENRKKFKDITKRRFGELTALSPTNKRKDGTVVWHCQCDCGKMVDVSLRQLVRGYVKSCGTHEDVDLLGKQFGELVVQAIDSKKKECICLCSCGKVSRVNKYNLIYGHTKSCGHLKGADNFFRVNGVSVSHLNKKVPSNNTSGYVGVSKLKSGKWTAYITLKYHRHCLGTFANIFEAAAAREKAEKALFSPILKRAKKDPQWMN